jgi:hypothetical protein
LFFFPISRAKKKAYTGNKDMRRKAQDENQQQQKQKYMYERAKPKEKTYPTKVFHLQI